MILHFQGHETNFKTQAIRSLFMIPVIPSCSSPVETIADTTIERFNPFESLRKMELMVRPPKFAAKISLEAG
jgi:hypothetical protein